jgi:peroxiredoxin
MRLSLLLLGSVLCAGAQSAADKIKQGHSHYGKAFDEGPRTQPWEMKGIGSAPFPISHKNPEVQKWFNQGNTLLHSFWDYEAERAFRWALKLEPENAMVYWGLARATGGERSKELIKQAARRKDTVTERERLYIEALEKLQVVDMLRDRSGDYELRNKEYKKALETLILKYPDDIEAKALLAYANMGDGRMGSELLIREVLTRHPDHPGAHHYRIHNWNYHEPEQALVSCKRYGEIAPGSGHALHMPGHVYATVGMWHEAAISMDAATRVEKRLMKESLTFPFNHWNYGHNRNYLSYIQEQLGMADAAIFGARQLIDAPLDPKRNSDSGFSSHSQGIIAMLRAHVKFERWKALLDWRTIPWRDIFSDKMNKSYAEARAHLGLGDLLAAEKLIEAHAALKKDLDKNKQFEKTFNLHELELKARWALAKGQTLQGLGLLSDAAEKQFELQRGDNDPPFYPEVLYVSLGRAYLAAKSPELAAKAFERALELTRNDIFALAGLVEARNMLGQRKEAEAAMARLLFTASDADAGLTILERARATGIKAEPKDSSPGPQRRYARHNLDRYGPVVWEPFESPQLDVRDPEGKPVSLNDYKDKNVILVFYLGRECIHCMSQLQAIQGKKGEWERLGAVVLAVSSNAPEANKEVLKGAKYDAIRFLSDSNFENSRRFRSYDDFEEMELHSTILLDKKGRVHWGITGGEPFGDMAFLVKQLERMNKSVEGAPKSSSGE